MKKLILRLVVSGLAIAGIAVAVILIFFQSTPLEASYNLLANSLQENGAICQMKKAVNEDEDLDIFSDEYKVLIKSEFNQIENLHAKLALVDNQKGYDSVLEATKNYLNAVELTNHKINVYKDAKNDNDVDESAKTTFENELKALLAEQLASANILNEAMLECLDEVYYEGIYDYDFAVDYLEHAFSKKFLADTTNATAKVELEKISAVNVRTEKLEKGKNLSTNEIEFVYASQFIDVVKLVNDNEEKAYFNGFSEERKGFAEKINVFISTLPNVIGG